MNISYYKITLDINSTQSQVTIPIKRADNTKGLLITLTDGDKPYVIQNNCSAMFKAENKEGYELVDNCILVGNRIRYDLCFNYVGVFNCDVSLYDVEGNLLTSPMFTIVVDKRAADSGDWMKSSEYKPIEKYALEFEALKNSLYPVPPEKTTFAEGEYDVVQNVEELNGKYIARDDSYRSQLDCTDGTVEKNGNSFMTSTYIPLNSADELFAGWKDETEKPPVTAKYTERLPSIAFYREDNSFISGLSLVDNPLKDFVEYNGVYGVYYEIPDGTAYCRLCTVGSFLAEQTIKKFTYTQGDLKSVKIPLLDISKELNSIREEICGELDEVSVLVGGAE